VIRVIVSPLPALDSSIAIGNLSPVSGTLNQSNPLERT
jgi:hypothetical protein